MSSRNLLQNNFNKFLPGKVSVANLGNIQGDSINENAIRSKFESTFTVTADELKANKKNSLMIQFLVNLACYGGSNVADQKRGIDFKSLTISNLMRAYIFDIYRAILKFQIKAKKITKGPAHDLMLKKDATMKDYKVDEWKLIAEFVKEKSTLYSKYVRTGKTLTDRQTSTLILPGIFLIPKKLEISQDAFAVYTSISTAIGDLAEIQNSEDTAEQSLIYMKKVSNLSKAMDAKYYTEGMNMYKALKQADSIVGHSSKDLLDIFAVFKSKPIYEKGLALNQANLSRGKGKSKLTSINAKQQTSNKSN